MKKTYLSPAMELQFFETSDVITISPRMTFTRLFIHVDDENAVGVVSDIDEQFEG